MDSQFLASDSAFQIIAGTALLAHVAALLAVFLFRKGFRPVAILNIIVACGLSAYLLPRMFRTGFAVDGFLFLLLLGELVLLVASFMALSGAARAPYATVLAWVGYCGNFALSAMLFWLAFFFRMTRLF